MKTITIQPDATKKDPAKLPYPFHIKRTTEVGRQEMWKGNPAKLLGFSKTLKVVSEDISFKDFWEHPFLSVGLYAIFTDKEGKPYIFREKIKSVRVND